MATRPSYPPVIHHARHPTHLPPTAAQSHLAAFIALTPTNPHLHPDSLLSSTGITYSAHSGPSGGLALHHLRRIEAGLRGENLIAETDAELAKFKESEDGEYGKEGDDTKLDESIARRAQKDTKKRKRTAEIRDWAEDTSSAADVPPQELESFAHNTPVHESEWQDQREFELEQRPLEGEVGEREGAEGEREGMPLGVVDHGKDGGVKRTLGEAEKKARKEAKKARRRGEKIRERDGG